MRISGSSWDPLFQSIMHNIRPLTLGGHKVLHKPAADAHEAKGTLILLHGYGADEYDLMGLANYFDPDLHVLSVRGNGATPFGGASWFDIDMLADGSLRFNVEQALASTSSVISLIESIEKGSEFHADQYLLGGFSQGASISQLVTLQLRHRIRGLLIMSGRLTESASALIQDQSVFKGLPVFAGHGQVDQVIPLAFGREIVEFWGALPVELEHHEYAMGHEINPQELEHIQAWLDRLIH